MLSQSDWFGTSKRIIGRRRSSSSVATMDFAAIIIYSEDDAEIRTVQDFRACVRYGEMKS
jgi:hypothetical protein